MFENVLSEQCEVWDSTVSDDGRERRSWRKNRTVDCFFIPRQGRKVLDEAGEEVVTSGDMLLTEEIDIHSERIVYDGYMYEGIDLSPRKEPFASSVQLFVLAVAKRRSINEIETAIS